MPTLDWFGKKAVLNHHQQVPYHLLKDVTDLSVGDPGTGNLIVKGEVASVFIASGETHPLESSSANTLPLHSPNSPNSRFTLPPPRPRLPSR